MVYKGIEYQVVQSSSPDGWKWTVFLGAKRTRTGESTTRADAVLDAERAIDKALKVSDKPG